MFAINGKSYLIYCWVSCTNYHDHLIPPYLTYNASPQTNLLDTFLSYECKDSSDNWQTYQRTCCIVQCPESICLRTVHRACQRRRSSRDSTSNCCQSIPTATVIGIRTTSNKCSVTIIFVCCTYIEVKSLVRYFCGRLHKISQSRSTWKFGNVFGFSTFTR